MPQAVLDRRMRKGLQQVLIHWHGLSPADATWEDLRDMKHRFSKLALEDKGEIREGGAVVCISGYDPDRGPPLRGAHV